MTTAMEKFTWIERKGQSLCAWFTQFVNCKSRDFILEILSPGDYGVWKWAGDDFKIPPEKSWELGEFMIGLRSCLDVAVYEMSRKAVSKGLIKPSRVNFPILRSGRFWTDSTVSWLTESDRQRVKQAQRFAERRSYDVDVVLINALANCDKHRSLVRVAVSSAACGQIGGDNRISFAQAKDLGLGSPDPQGWYTASTAQGSSAGTTKNSKFVTGGPLGGLAITGTIPTIHLHVADDLELDDEDDMKRLAQMPVVEAIKQATYEIRDILSILADGTERVTDQEITDGKNRYYSTMMAAASEALQIYQSIPLDKDLRPGWSMHLKQLDSCQSDTV